MVFRKLVRRSATVALVLSALLPQPSTAYPIDCAILLCMAGGFPASAECAAAKAEVIRRVTPVPVEPPLQLWRCPLNAGHSSPAGQGPALRIFRAAAQFSGDTEGDALPPLTIKASPLMLSGPTDEAREQLFRAATEGGTVDLNDPALRFIRTIRVFHVSLAWQRLTGKDDDNCRQNSTVRLGTYAADGAFRWHSSRIEALPPAHVGLERWGQMRNPVCPGIFHRSVFIEWNDYFGNYGYEQIRY